MTPIVQNPNDPAHCMWIVPLGRRVRVRHVGTEDLIAETAEAVHVIEHGRRMYTPVVYLPLTSITAELRPSDAPRTTCPIKGQAHYFDLVLQDGAQISKAAWTYPEPVEGAEALAGLFAFYLHHISVEDAPL